MALSRGYALCETPVTRSRTWSIRAAFRRSGAKNCGEEYQQIKFAFEKTILPFVDQEQMAKVRERQWFQPAELQELPHSNHCRFVTISGRSGVIKCVAEG